MKKDYPLCLGEEDVKHILVDCPQTHISGLSTNTY